MKRPNQLLPAAVIRTACAAALAGVLLFAGCSSGDEQASPEARDALLRTALEQSGRGEILASMRTYRRILDIDSLLQLQDRRADDELTLGRIEASLGYLESAIGREMGAWELYRQSGRRPQEISVMTDLGLLYYQLGMLGEAIPILTDALTIAKLTNDDQLLSLVTCALGDAYTEERRYGKAVEMYRQALDAAQRRNDVPGTIRYRSRIGLAWAEANEAENSSASFADARQLAAASLGHDPAQLSFDEGRACQALGDWPGAARAFEAARSELAASQSSSATALRAGIAAALGDVYAHSFAFAPAKQEFQDAFTMLRESGLRRPLAYLLMAVGDCTVRLGATKNRSASLAEAAGYYTEAAGLLNKAGDRYGESAALVKLARTNEDEGNTDAALSLYRQAFEITDATLSDPPLPLTDDPLGIIYRLPWDHELSGLRASFWYEPYVALLAHMNRTGEALWYYERARDRAGWKSLQLYTFEPKENSLRSDLEGYRSLLRTAALREGEELARKSQEAQNRDPHDIEILDRSAEAARQALQSAATACAGRHQQFELLFKPSTVSLDELRPALPIGAAVADYFVTEDRLLIFLVDAPEGSAALRTLVLQVPVYRDVLLEKLRLYRSMIAGRLTRAATSRGDFVSLDGLGIDLYNTLIRPLEAYLPAHLIIVPDDAMRGIPFHALSADGRTPLLAGVDVSYLPSLDALLAPAPPRSIGSVTAAGNPTGKDWALDFELRDIRSFFRETEVVLAQNVTEERIEACRSELLQLSTEFTTDAIDPSRSTFILSNGSISAAGVPAAISDLLRFPAFPVVYLSDQQKDHSGLSVPFARLLMMNGTSGVIMNLFGTDAKTNKAFSEAFYAALGSGDSPHDAYRKALLDLKRSPATSPTYVWPSFFYYGK